MRTRFNHLLLPLAAVSFLFCAWACEPNGAYNGIPSEYKDAFSVSMPDAGKELTKVSLSEGEQSLVGATNALAFKLLDKLYSGKSVVNSPLSLYLSLGMAANGAGGNTQKELLTLLGGDIDAVNAFSKSLLEQLPAVDLKTKVRLADAIVLNDRFKLQNQYKQAVEGYFYAPVESMPFSDPALVADVVNAWCKRQTEGLIPEIIKKGDVTPDLSSILLNALYFKAQWLKPFENYQVSQRNFYGLSKKIDYLNEQKDLLYIDKGDYHIVSRLYSNGKYRFYILLPKADDGLQAMLSELRKENWASLACAMKSNLVELLFPKIETTSDMRLKDILIKLGVQDAFNISADFSRMLENSNAYISEILQKAKISVNEYGTEAAAVTATLMPTNAGPGFDTPTPIPFIADHPFVYLIAESSSNIILFSGIFDGN